MNLKKSQPAPADEMSPEAGSSSASTKLLLVGGGVVALGAAGALAFVLLSGGDDVPETTSALPAPTASATPSATEAAGTPSPAASSPTYAAKNARDPFKALVTDSTGKTAGGSTGGGGSVPGPTTAPGGGGGGIITLPGRTITVTQTITSTSTPTSVPTGSPTGDPTGSPTSSSTPSTSTKTIELPHGTQLVYIEDVVKDADGDPESVTVVVDNKAYKGLTPQRDVDPAKWETFGTYYVLVGLTDTTATIRYGDGTTFDVSVGQYHVVQS
jgi:hypothetical protein